MGSVLPDLDARIERKRHKNLVLAPVAVFHLPLLSLGRTEDLGNHIKTHVYDCVYAAEFLGEITLRVSF